MNIIMKNQKEANEFIKDNVVICVAILCITALEVFAIAKGINGIMMTFVIGAICAAAGVTIKRPKIFQ